MDDMSRALNETIVKRGHLEIGASGFKHYYSGTYDELWIAEDGLRVPLLARVRVRSDEGSGGGLLHQHELMQRLPTGIGPRSLHVDCSCEDVRFPFRVEEFLTGVQLQKPDDGMLVSVAAMLARLHGRMSERAAARTNVRPQDLCALSMMLPLLEPDPTRDARIEQVSAVARKALQSDAVVNADESFTMLHGDIHFGNILIHERGSSLVDWEHIAVGDPAIDVATLFWFSALMGLEERPLLYAQQSCFFKEYLASTGDEGIVERVRAYEAIATALQLTAWSEQLRRLDEDTAKSADRARRAEEIRSSLARAVSVVERDGSHWLRSSSTT